jgi:alpha-aminoadipic semialdehyde synthase
LQPARYPEQVIGIRREDKNRWERRAPLTPEHVAQLVKRHDLALRVQPSSNRAFSDQAYRDAGAGISEDLEGCEVVLGVKEIPVEKIRAGVVYAYFAHVIKGQSANMPALRRLMDLGCSLIEYERIVDEEGRRLIFFGRHAGYAGMIDAFWALGRRLQWEGIDNPFAAVRLAHEYADLEEAREHLEAIGREIRRDGIPDALHPLVVGFTGSGNASLGAQDIFHLFPFEQVRVGELPGLAENRDLPRDAIFKVVFERRHRVERADGGSFDADDAVSHPAGYRSAMPRHLPFLSVLVNAIYWDPRAPRVVGREDLARLWTGGTSPRLRVIADISCDIEGSVEATVRATTPGDPVFVYDPRDGSAVSGVAGHGPVVLAVDNLPCEIPKSASGYFGDALYRYLPALARCDWSRPVDALDLPEEIRRAIVVHRGELAPSYRHLGRALEAAGA